MIVLARRRVVFTARASLVAAATALGACAQGSPADELSLTTSADSTLGTITMGGVTAQLVLVNDWGTGYQASVRMQNTGAASTSWQTAITLNGSTVASSWNALVTGGGTAIGANEPWNAAIPSQSAPVEVWGFVGAGSGRPRLESLSVGTAAGIETATGNAPADAGAPADARAVADAGAAAIPSPPPRLPRGPAARATTSGTSSRRATVTFS